ncbi:MAG: hypothetical protein HY246_01175 [Proteobacteria bacterium]|nr:hypothetical protein [Pseudomonadota bacterium]
MIEKERRADKNTWWLQPRDDLGQWTDEDGPPGAGRLEPGGDAGNGPSAQGAQVAQAGPWVDPWPQSSLTADFRNTLHQHESLGYANHGYAAQNADGGLGRYQMLPDAQIDVGLRNADGSWNPHNRYGARNEAAFLANPATQERAIDDYLDLVEDRLQRNGSTLHINQQFRGSLGTTVTITMAGLIAAAHRYGQTNVRRYLNYLIRNNWASDFSTLLPRERGRLRAFQEIETRLREFEAVPLRP